MYYNHCVVTFSGEGGCKMFSGTFSEKVIVAKSCGNFKAFSSVPQINKIESNSIDTNSLKIKTNQSIVIKNGDAR